jgi:hypothetical protein
MKGFKVEWLQPEETHVWLLKKHYAHRLPCITDSFGLYTTSNILVGVCTFGVPASNNLCEGICGAEYKGKVRELNRLVIDDDISKNNKGVLSFFVSVCMRHMGNTHLDGLILVSYADDGQGHHGYIYQATNWLYTGKTKERTDIFTGEGKHSRHYGKDCDYSKRQIRTAKHRYVYFPKCGRTKWSKILKQQLKYPICEYPKGDNKRYDASYKPITQDLLF